MKSIPTKTLVAEGQNFQLFEDASGTAVSIEVDDKSHTKLRLSKESMEELCRKYMRHVIEEAWNDACVFA